MGTVAWDLAIMGTVSVVFIAILSGFARRVLGVRIGSIRLVLAAAFGLGAEMGFESRFVWNQDEYTPALLPIQIGILFFAATAFLVVSDLVMPTGTVPRPDQWWPRLVARYERSRRYAALSRIAWKNKLLPFRPDDEPTAAGSAERTRQARALRNALEDAGGAFVKLGQMLSTRTDLLPQEYLSELSSLQERVPAAEWDDVRALVESELGGPIDAHFGSFADAPLAAASIGQVHRAALLDGREVAVKVQRPGIVAAMERDLDIARRIAKRLERDTDWGRGLGVVALVTGFTDDLRVELDYRAEARNIAAMALTQERHPAEERVGIPEYFPALCTERVLTMELVEGDTLSDAENLARHSLTERREQAQRLLRSTLSQIVGDGVFHADLHPGNIVLRDDGEVVLLDFGSVSRLDSQLRSQVGDLLIGFYRSDSVAFANALLELVTLPDDADVARLRRQIGAFIATYLGPGGSLDATVFNEMMRMLTTHRVAIPPQLTTTLRAVATLEGTLRHLDPDFDMLASSSAYAEEQLTSALSPGTVAATINDQLAAMLPMVRRLAERVDQVTGDLATGRLRVNVRLFADRRDQRLIRGLVNLIATTFLAGVLAATAAMLLISEGGPDVGDSLTLFQVFGYLLVILSGILTLRVLFDVFDSSDESDPATMRATGPGDGLPALSVRPGPTLSKEF